MLVVDYWSGEWGNKEIDQTNAELIKSNVGWIFLAPAWDFKSFDPPVIENIGGGTIQYNDAQLRNHIEKIKRAGLEVVLGPQLCCKIEPDSFTNKSTGWWDNLFAEYEKFMLYHARISEETGVKIFVVNFPIQSLPGTPGAPADTEKRWENLYEKIRAVYHEKIALFDYVCCGAYDEGIGGISRLFSNNFNFFEKFDLFAVSMWNPLSKTDDPAQDELDKNAARIMDEKIKYIYERYKKPIIMQTAYRSADGGSRGTQKYSVDLVNKDPNWKEFAMAEIELGGKFKSQERETITKKIHLITYDGTEQAMIYESLMKAVAERNWIIGVYPFIYHMVGFDFPRHPDSDIRRKPAETIIENWYKSFKFIFPDNR